MRQPSLARRLSWALVLANILAFLGISSAFVFNGLSGREDELIYALDRASATLGGAVVVDDLQHPLIDPGDEAWNATSMDIRGLRYLVFDPAAEVFVAGSDPELIEALGESWLRGWDEAHFKVTLPDGRPVRGSLATVVVAGHPLRVAVAGGEAGGLHDFWYWLEDELLREVLPAVLPVLAVSLILALIAVRRGMAPVKAVAQSLVGLDPARGKVELERDAVPSEIVPLVDAVNASLARVSEAFEHERRFLADAAHELRTPIAVLRGRVDSLDDRATAARLAADVDRLGHIVDRLLTRARIEQGKAPLVPVDIVALARDIVAECAPMVFAAGRDIELQTALAGPLMIDGDRDALAEALRNLIGNAVHFTAPATVVEIAVEETDAAVIEVRDRGPGLPDKTLGDLFAPFVSSRPSGSGHAGLGLAIVAAAARRHGGRAEAVPRPGGGAVFRLVLPLA